jgi:hypothetical protein
MQGFYTKNKQGQIVLDYPKIRWNDLNLRDETQKNQMFLQMWDKGIISTQFVCERMDIDYDTETERIRLESAFQQQMGIAPQKRSSTKGLGGGYGGGGGGIGGDIGGIGGKDENAGNLPGGQSGPGLPGDDLAPSMSGGKAGGGAMNSGAPTPPPMAAYETEMQAYERDIDSFQKAKDYTPDVSRRKRTRRPKEPISPRVEKIIEEKIEEEIPLYEGDRTGMFRLTELEQILYSKIKEAQDMGNLPEEFIIQEKPEPELMARVEVDGFFPSLKLIVEADGKQWHSSPEDIAKNEERDERFRQLGWTILRYTEEDLKGDSDAVIAHIIQVVKEMQEGQKAASNEDIIKESKTENSLFENFLKTTKVNKKAENFTDLLKEIEE